MGIYGGSYCAWTTVMVALDPHPALNAVSEPATPADMFIGYDPHHNGAFRLDRHGHEANPDVELRVLTETRNARPTVGKAMSITDRDTHIWRT